MPDDTTNDGTVALSILRDILVGCGSINVTWHSGGYIGIGINGEFYGNPAQANLLERLLDEEDKELRPDLYEETD